MGGRGTRHQACLCSHAGPGLESGLCCVVLRKSLSLSGPPFLLWEMKTISVLIPWVITDVKCSAQGLAQSKPSETYCSFKFRRLPHSKKDLRWLRFKSVIKEIREKRK